MRAAPAGASADVLRRTLDEALGTIAELVAAADASAPPEAAAALDACVAQLRAGASPEALDPLAAECLEAARSVAAELRSQSAERRTQVAALLAMVRETVSTLAGEATLHESLAESAERFERLADTDDLQRIQAQLAREIGALKRITMERRQAWEQACRDFGTRLTTLETQLDHTRREAAVDPLTNIANRRTFERICREWLGPSGPGFVIAMVDVDDFKAINDQYGHAVGDRVLVAVAETLAGSFRADDVVARLGGDEFAVLAASLTLAQAERRYAMVGRAVQEACAPLVPGGTAPSISIGLAECSAGDTLESLQHRADAALYQAKRSGKGRLAAKASPLIRDLLAREARAR